MSPRLPASGLGFLLTITFLSGLVLQVPLAAAVGEHVFESNPTVSNADLDVFRDQSVAQSFVATETYRILNATLRLRNMGATTDAIRVSVHGDAGERPAASALDTTQVVSGGAAAFVNAPFPAAPVLSRGARYWIVASHPGLLSDSYRWSHSNANTYASGRAMYDLNLGGGWFNVTPSTDMVFTTYGREDEANVSVDLSVSPVEASWKDTVRFTVRYTNAGTLPARNVWINATLPAGLSYVSDQAAGSTTAYPSFTFADVPNGVHPFTIDARVLVGSSPGATLTASVALEYRNGAGMPGAGSASQASVVVGLATDSLFLVDGTPYGLSPSAPTGGAASQRNVTIRRSSATVDFDLVRAFARPFRGVRAEAFLYLDSRSGSAETVDLNLTLYDVGGTATPVAYAQGRVTTNVATDYEAFAISFPAFDHVFPQGDSLRLRVRNPASSTDDIVLAFGSSLAPSRIDVRTSTHARIDTVERRDAVGPTGAWTSLDAIVVHANVSDPLGPSRILGVRVNATGPDSNPVSADAGMAVLTTDASPLPAWKVFEFRLGPPLMNGTYGFELTADGAAGDYVVVTSVDVRSPAFDLAVGATQSNVAFGERFFYLVYYNNTGASSASRVWLNVSYAPQLLFIGSSDPASESGVSNWSWSSVGPGIHRLDLEVLVDSVVPVPFLRSTFALDVVDGKGHAWPRVSTQADVAMNGPVIAFSQTPSTPAVHSNEPVTFTFALANTGDLAQTLWLNDTLPAGLEYVSNDAATIGGTTTFSGGAIRFVFTNLPTTTWSFQLVVQGSPGIAPGSVLVNRADLNFTNSNGSLMPPQQSDGSVQAFAPQIVGSIFVTPGVATPGDAASIAIDVSNTGNEPAPYLWLNLSLDAGLRFLDASRPATVATSTVRFQIADFWVGSDRIFVNVTLDRSASDGQTFLGTAAAAYRDAVGNPMATAPLGTATLQASAPRVTVSAVPPIATIEAGASLILTISHANAGSGTAGDVWLNVSLPPSLVYVSDTSDGFLTRQIYSLLSWHWSDFAPGSRAFQLELEARSTTADGTAEEFAFRTEYTDRNGNWNAGAGASAHVDFVAPEIQLDLQADRRDVAPGSLLSYALRLRNLGSTPAREVWLLDSVDPRFEIVTYEATVPATGGPTMNWTFADLDPGEEEVVNLTLRVREATAGGTPIANVFEAIYTNSQSEVIGYTRSVPVTIIVTGIAIPTTYLLIAGGSAAGLAGLVLVLRRRGTQVEEVFLVYRDGVLIYHLSRSLVQDRDEDVLSGMLTAVQEFVRDAFRYGEHRQLHQLDFGDYRILIERGQTVYLAVVYSGPESPGVRRKVRSVLDRIESSYSDVLETWNGDMDKVVGARDIIRDYLLKAGRTSRTVGG